MKRIPQDMAEGTEFQTNNFGVVSIVEYISAKNIKIKFKNSGSEKVCCSRHVRSGNIRDTAQPTIHKVGFLGGIKYKARRNGKISVEYASWRGMMDRCYCPKTQLKQPTYKGCSVDPIWHNFQNFAEWHQLNYRKGFQIDKDILFPGNKVYSPNNCRLIHGTLNKLLTSRENDRGDLPRVYQGIGVDFSPNYQ